LDALLEQMKLDQLKPKEKRRGRKKTKGDHR
jgi:hypothetical protein